MRIQLPKRKVVPAERPSRRIEIPATADELQTVRRLAKQNGFAAVAAWTRHLWRLPARTRGRPRKGEGKTD